MNDERPIEKLLRRFAKKRRDEAGAPAELHPANRRLLQAEVARQFPKAQPRAGWWAGLSLLLNRKLAFAVAVVAVIAVGTLLTLPTKKNELGMVAFETKRAASSELPATSTVAVTEELKPTTDAAVRTGLADAHAAKDSLAGRNEPFTLAERSEVAANSLDASPKQVSPPALTLAPASAAVPTDEQRDPVAARRQQVTDSIAKFNEQDVKAKASSAKLDSPVNYPTESVKSAGAPMLATVGSVTNAGSSEVFSRRYGLAPATPAPAAKTPTRAVIKAEPPPTGSASSAQIYRENWVQSFSQVPVNGQVTSGRSAGAITPVLANFTVEQTGDQIRVTDSDGSTYTGLVQFASQENVAQKGFIARGGGLEKSRQSQTSYNAVATDAGLAGDLNSQNLFFKVSGTNRSLKQQVNFIGNFVVLSNQAVSAYDAAQFSDKAKNAPTQQPVLPLLQNSAIQGQLQIGSSREMKLNAVPVKQ